MLHVFSMVIREKISTQDTQEGNEKGIKTWHYKNSTEHKERQQGFGKC